MYGILAIHEVLHTIRLRGYEEGMASCHTRSLHTIRLRGYGKDAIPSYKKAPADILQELFCILIRPLQSFEHLLNEVVDVALIASVGFLYAAVGDNHAYCCGFVTHEACKSGEC